MEITKDDEQIILTKEDFDYCVHGLLVMTYCKDGEDLKLIKQILKNQEKSKKYDELQIIPDDVITSIDIIGWQKQIKELKEQVTRELKDNNGLRVTVGKYFKLKQKLEEILEAIKEYRDSVKGEVDTIALDKILKEN